MTKTFKTLFKSRPKVTLPLFLVLPFLIQILVIVGLTGWFSFQNGQTAIYKVTKNLRDGITSHIQDEVRGYISLPPLINQITANAIKSGQLNLDNEPVRHRHFWQQVRTFPDSISHFIGRSDGEFITARRTATGEVQVGIANGATNQLIHYFTADENGDRLKLAEVIPNRFDPRTRPWYITAVTEGRPVWTDIYRHFVTKGLTISATQPIYGNQNQLIGVVSTDFVFLQLNKFLGGLKVGKTGQAFIMERSGALISSSEDDQVFTITGETTERVFAQKSSNPIIQQVAAAIYENPEYLEQLQQKDFNFEIAFNVANAKYFAQVSPLRDAMGIDWLIVVIIPESDFMEKIHESSRITILLGAIAILVSLLVGLNIARRITQPILNLANAVQNLAECQELVTLPEEGIEELRILATSFNTMSSQLESTFMDLHHSAYHDPLTNLPNRSAFLFSLENRISHHKVDPDYLFALLFLDLDRFKLVNDSLGHLVGDMLLVAVTKRLQSCLRKTDMLSRFGGDEFIILLNDIPHIEFANDFADRIQKALIQPFDIEGHQIYTSTSIGIVSPLNSTGSPQDLLRDADIALYKAKQDGKACSKMFDGIMHDQASALLQLETDLRRALVLPVKGEEFEVFYQPIIAIQNLKIVGCEALVRWHHPVRGLLSPGLFLAVAEDMGAISSIDWWVLEQACQQMQTWLTKFPQLSLQQISVNLSSTLFMQPQWVERIEQILQASGLKPCHLKLELVESTLMDSTNTTRDGLARLRQMGIKLDIDDFGTGYSSLSYLCKFPLDTIKIDRSFIIDLKENLEIVRAIIVLAQNLGMQTVAEGVENQEQLEILQKLGCDHVQGYLFAPPISADHLIEMINKSKSMVKSMTWAND